MRRKAHAAELRILKGFVIVALVTAGLIALVGSVGGAVSLAVLVLIVGGLVAVRHHHQQRRLEQLRAKYGSEAIVQRILQRQYWQDQTEDQLRDALGPPVEIDDKRLKTLRREVWKYQKTGVNRFRLRITLENGVVVGWESKA